LKGIGTQSRERKRADSPTGQIPYGRGSEPRMLNVSLFDITLVQNRI